MSSNIEKRKPKPATIDSNDDDIDDGDIPCEVIKPKIRICIKNSKSHPKNSSKKSEDDEDKKNNKNKKSEDEDEDSDEDKKSNKNKKKSNDSDEEDSDKDKKSNRNNKNKKKNEDSDEDEDSEDEDSDEDEDSEEEEKKEKYPEIPDDIDIFTVATKYTPLGWKDIFETKKKELKIISENLKKISNDYEYTPRNRDIFRAFYLTPLNKVRVVILGQDPYPTAGVATGLAFSVSKETPIPASLANIFKELINEFPKYKMPTHGNLDKWAQQGVFLLNTCLTCNVGQAGSHSKYQLWLPFISSVLEAIGRTNKECFYLLWGRDAQSMRSYITAKNEFILTASHPSPLSANKSAGNSHSFFGCGHFKTVNAKLNPPIDWQIK